MTPAHEVEEQKGELFQAALERTVRLAREQGLVDERDVAVDPVRLRAHASTKQVRTLKRSRERLGAERGRAPGA